MKNGTNIFIGEKDIKSHTQVDIGKTTPRWVTARPVGYISPWHTLKCAWLVLKGKADIVIWKYQ